ncbi:hypothetical protein I5677_09475 [Mobilitalea sibirica]|uniref:Uncharacterized protein n=1 Tax=Mobilitalea sibirica TaxID=1462919 RepID=A0A8J7H9I0_9FIRM|nr:hypothetical protein [Mobilitalea sibirica]MBH1941120.1 hypothetical protein [Mobilitalea sibirica]
MDGSNNLLSGGVEVLNEIKDNLLELHGNQTKYDSLMSDEEKLDKSIRNMEKSISDEILDTTKNRRQEIEETFDKQIDKIKAKIRKTKEKRDKRKSSKVSERIHAETADLREENNQLNLDAKTIFKQKHVPSWCNTRLYYALYYPKGLGDLFIIVTTLLITLFIIPCGIYFFILPEEKIFYLILTYIATVLFFGGIYLITGNRTKEKHREEILQVKGLRSQIRVNHKKMAVIKRNILKDRDESSYGLENFDEELNRLDREAADIANQKKEALLLFDNTTSQVIATEIKSRYEEKLSGLKEEYKQVSDEAGKADDRIKALTIKIASVYEPFIGKDLMTLDRLDSLINIIQAGSANNISEAIAFHKQSMNKI